MASVFKTCLVCIQGDLGNVDTMTTAGVATPRLSEGEAVGTDTPTSIPMATPQVLGECHMVYNYLSSVMSTVCALSHVLQVSVTWIMPTERSQNI